MLTSDTPELALPKPRGGCSSETNFTPPSVRQIKQQTIQKGGRLKLLSKIHNSTL